MACWCAPLPLPPLLLLSAAGSDEGGAGRGALSGSATAAHKDALSAGEYLTMRRF